jgi:hypothetical protein
VTAREITCPFCPSRVTITSHDTGVLEVRHHETYGPECETALLLLLSEEVAPADMKIMFRN